MEITKSQLKKIIKEELNGLRKERHNRSIQLLNEQIKKQGLTSRERRELVQLIEEGAISDFMAGEGTTVADIQASDLSTSLGKLEAFASLMEWALDWLPNAAQELAGQEEAEVGGLIKGLRIFSRVITGPGLLILKATKGIINMMKRSAGESEESAGAPAVAIGG